MRDNLWLRWVGANSLAETFGLGATFLTGYLVMSALGDPQNAGMSLLNLLLMSASGIIEGWLVGYLQWNAMAPWLPEISRKTWVLATVFGALLAWFFGSLPFSLMDMGAQQTGVAPVEPPQSIILLGAAGIGLVAGAILAFFQWLALRKVISKAGWWIPANMLAWAAGMPIIFWGIDRIYAGLNPGTTVVSAVLLLAITGAVVGAIHGAFLVRLVRCKKEPDLAGSGAS